MANEQAVYFIHGCQELRDQVQRMIVEDGLYTAIKTAKVSSQGWAFTAPAIQRSSGNSGLPRVRVMTAPHAMLFTEVRTVIITIVSADGVLRSRQGISRLQHSQSDH
jgi:hypothetical protein